MITDHNTGPGLLFSRWFWISVALSLAGWLAVVYATWRYFA